MDRRNFVKTFVALNTLLPTVAYAKEEETKEKEYKYNENYMSDFDLMDALGYQTGKKILTVFSKYYWPESVVDYGCGTGLWLKVYSEWGIKNYKGYDLYTPENRLHIPVENFGRINLEKKDQTCSVKEHYDLSICVETVEHLHKEFSDDVVDLLTRTSDVVLFSGAVPYQVGHHHHNCHPPKFWADKFAQRDFICFDILRQPLMEMDTEIDWWYNQNILIFCRKDKADMFTAQGFKPTENPMLIYSKYCVDIIIKNVRQFKRLPS